MGWGFEVKSSVSDELEPVPWWMPVLIIVFFPFVVVGLAIWSMFGTDWSEGNDGGATRASRSTGSGCTELGVTRKRGEDMGWFKKSLPAPMEPWMVKRGWDEEEVFRRLDQCCLVCSWDEAQRRNVYWEPGANAIPDLWTNPGKPGTDRWTRDMVRRDWMNRLKAQREQESMAWLNGLWAVVQVLFFFMTLPFMIIGLKDSVHSWLGTGEYGGRNDGW